MDKHAVDHPRSHVESTGASSGCIHNHSTAQSALPTPFQIHCLLAPTGILLLVAKNANLLFMVRLAKLTETQNRASSAPVSAESIARSNQMRLITSRNTKPEMVVRKYLWRLGYRYRLHQRKLPGTPDLVFAGRRKVVFINGCFWHQHPDPDCRLTRMPKSRLSYWQAKLLANQARDEVNHKSLIAKGWMVFVVWECELRKPQSDVLHRLVEFLES